MKVIQDFAKLDLSDQSSVVAIGVFDGVHCGHQSLINQAIERAKKIGGTSVVLTFWPHPVHVLKPEVRLSLLMSLDHRLKVIASLGADVCVVLRFTKEFSRLSPKQFIDRYLVKKIKPVEIFVGYDFRFGHERSGGLDIFESLGKDYGFHVNVLNPVKNGEQPISSTRIRELIADGNLDAVQKLLGRPVSVMGVVKKGDARGKLLGYPTANIYPSYELIPPRGVYAVKVEVQGQYYDGMANVGQKPSFHKHNTEINIEVHLFDFDQKIYDESIVIEFIKKIRNEKAFNSKEQLVAQLKEDEQKVKSIFHSRL